MVRNKVADLREDELNIVLSSWAVHDVPWYAGRTLREFVENEMLENATITDLYDEMQVWRLNWPFRTLNITVEVTARRGFTLGVLDDQTIDGYAHGDIDFSDIDPKCSVTKLYDETLADMDVGEVEYDYAVEDDLGRKLVEWD